MKRRTAARLAPPAGLRKASTGIAGLDEILEGGLPAGRPTLICGGAGSGKTLLTIEFLVRGANEFDEPGVFMGFEETRSELAQNVASLGFDLEQQIAQRKLVVDYVLVERSEIHETGEYDLEGLFVRLGHAIDTVGAKRVVIDSIETLFTGLQDTTLLRAELHRVFRWLKHKGVTALITAERGEGSLTRHGMEEYVSDCVILLDNRVSNQFATRRLRIVKYRGSRHGADEFPFMIGENGLSVLPITSLGLTHEASAQRISSGVQRLDQMLGGRGYYRGSSVVVSGTAGTGKSSLVAHFADATCRHGERALIFLLEESPSQYLRNMRSIGIDLAQWMNRDLLRIHAARPTLCGLESHLQTIHRLTADYDPAVVAVDPITNLSSVSSFNEARALLIRLIDFLKTRQVTALFTSLIHGNNDIETTDIGISSLMDVWLMLRDSEHNGERNRLLYVLKARGTAHSNQVREFRLTPKGIRMVDVYVGSGGVLTGTARLAQEARERDAEAARLEEVHRHERELQQRHQALEAQIAGLRLELETNVLERERLHVQAGQQRAANARDRAAMSQARQADAVTASPATTPRRRRGT
jgi:circadian clock protein KaiC